MTYFTLRTNDQRALVAVPIVLIALASICVGLRFRARQLQRAKLRLEDWLCLITLVMLWGFQGINISLVVNGGAGLEVGEVMMTDPNAVMVLIPKLLLSNFILWIVIVTLVQLCVMLFLLRIFGISPVFRYSAWALTLCILGLGIAGTLTQIFGCDPIRKAWMPQVPGTCIDPDASCKSVGLLHVAFDLLMVILPMPMVWNLKTALRNKVVISGLLGLGLIATLVSFLKLECVLGWPNIPKENVTRYVTFPLLMQTIELPIGLICCCVPCLKPAWKEIRFVSSSAAGRLLSLTGTRDTGKSSTYKSDLQTNESTRNFVPLHDGASENGSIRLGNKSGVRGADIELAPVNESQGGQSIHVVHSYSIRR